MKSSLQKRCVYICMIIAHVNIKRGVMLMQNKLIRMKNSKLNIAKIQMQRRKKNVLVTLIKNFLGKFHFHLRLRYAF
jgi:hypothetical protein